MKEKIRMLIEEANCDEGQAELALEAVQYDLEKAIRNIGALLRDFVVIKGKFYHPRFSMFGLIIVIANIKLRQMVRLHTVVSYNPVIYETDLSMKWITFEKQLFAHRLQDGAVRHLSQEIEQSFGAFLTKTESSSLFTIFNEGNTAEIRRIFSEQLKKHFHHEKITETNGSVPDDIIISFEREELSLTQFRHLEEDIYAKKSSFPAGDEGHGFEPLYLTVSLTLSPGGVRVSDLIEGAVVQSIIIDERDIAQYLGKLMGGRSGNQFVPLPSSISQVKTGSSFVEVQTWLAPNIIGIARLPHNTMVKVIYYADKGWWQRIFPW